MNEKPSTVSSAGERLYNGLIKENPTFVLMLGMCPTLAVTTSAINGLGMGLTTTAVLMLSNLMISLLRKVIPNRVRIPAFIVIIASFVTIVELLLEAYIPFLNKALGVYIPLIVVNCIILGRAESYAYSNPPIPSFFDGLGMGLGFSFALTCIGAVRELLGAGSLFGVEVLSAAFTPISIFGLAPGAFFVLAALTAFQNFLKNRSGKRKKKTESLPAGCTQDCTGCGVSGCGSHGKFYDNTAPAVTEEAAEKAASGQPADEAPEQPEEEKAEESEPEEIVEAVGKEPAEEPAEVTEKPAEEPEETTEAPAEEVPEAVTEEKPAEKPEEKPEEKPGEKYGAKASENRENTGQRQNQSKSQKKKSKKKNRNINAPKEKPEQSHSEEGR